MVVKYIVEAKYANGDDYADKVDSLHQVCEILLYIESDLNERLDSSRRILATQVSVTTEEQ